MIEEKGYNGWSSYETWLVKLWIDNDQGSYEYWQQVTAETNGDTTNEFMHGGPERIRVYKLAERLKDEIQGHYEESEICGTLGYDLMLAAFSEVDWREIAEAMIEEVEE